MATTKAPVKKAQSTSKVRPVRNTYPRTIAVVAILGVVVSAIVYLTYEYPNMLDVFGFREPSYSFALYGVYGIVLFGVAISLLGGVKAFDADKNSNETKRRHHERNARTFS